MSLTIQAKGLDETLRVFETRRVSPFFAIYQNRTILEQNVNNDYDEAIEKITNFFSTGSGYEATPLCFKMYQAHKKGNNDKEPVYASFFFTVSAMPVIAGTNENGLHYVINDLKEKVNSLTSELNAIKEIEEEEEEPEESETESFINGINNLINNPAVTNLIAMFTDKLMNNNTVTKLAGIEVDEKSAIYQYVEILLNKGVTAEHLQKLSQMPSSKIKMLLSML